MSHRPSNPDCPLCDHCKGHTRGRTRRTRIVILKVVNSVTVGRDILGILQEIVLFGSVDEVNGTQDPVTCHQNVLQKASLAAFTKRD